MAQSVEERAAISVLSLSATYFAAVAVFSKIVTLMPGWAFRKLLHCCSAWEWEMISFTSSNFTPGLASRA